MAKGIRVAYENVGVMSLWAYLLFFGLVHGQLNNNKFGNMHQAGGEMNKPFGEVGGNPVLQRGRQLPLNKPVLSNGNERDQNRPNLVMKPQHQDSDFVRPQANSQQGFPQYQKKSTTIKIAEHPACAKDVKTYCVSSTNNFAVLDCLQNDLKVCESQ